jgi:hypothetical protein
MNHTIDLQKNNIDMKTLQKMIFIYNALQKGWKVKKQDDAYVFYKNHEGKREIFRDDYLEKFIESNLVLDS